jgi:hypothetical protein
MKLEQLKKMIREVAKKEMLKEEEINWKAVQNAQKSLKLESASRTAMEIGGLTGLNKDAVQKFVDTHNLDIEKVFQFVKKGKLSDRMDFVTAVSGKPNNPIQKKIIKKLQESVNEGVKLSLVDPNTNKFIKTLSLDRTYREAEKEIETLNRRLSPSQKTKGLYWKVTSIGESVNEAGYTVKAKTPYEFVNGAYAVLSAYLRDEELGPKGKRELQDIIKSLEYMRKYFYFKMSESVNEDTKKRFDVDFYKSNGDRETSHEEIIRGDKFSDVVSQATKDAKSKGMNYVEFYHKNLFIGSIDKRNGYEFKKGRNSDKSPLSVNEATNSAKMMAGIKKGSQTGPWTIVVSFNKKVYYQTQVKTKNEIPAKFEHMKKVTNIPGYIFTIEDNTGMTVYSEKLLNEAKKYDIGSGYLGNGLTIWNRAEEKDGDYETIAHIGKDGKLTIYDKEIPADIKKMIGIWATSMKKGNRPGSY